MFLFLLARLFLPIPLVLLFPISKTSRSVEGSEKEFEGGLRLSRSSFYLFTFIYTHSSVHRFTHSLSRSHSFWFCFVLLVLFFNFACISPCCAFLCSEGIILCVCDSVLCCCLFVCVFFQPPVFFSVYSVFAVLVSSRYRHVVYKFLCGVFAICVWFVAYSFVVGCSLYVVDYGDVVGVCYSSGFV